MNFRDRLNSAITRALREEEEPLGDPMDTARAEKTAVDLGRAADQAVSGLEEIHGALERSGYTDNEVVQGIMTQIGGLLEGLKKGGPLRQNLENLLKIPVPQE